MMQVMKVLLCVVSIGPLAELAHCQPVENKPDGWVDVLRSDPRLKVPVKLKFASRPTSEELLDIVRKATGVALTLAEEPKGSKVIFGSMSGNAPAWKVMELLAKTQFTDGRWEKTGDGYVLHGKPKVVISPELAKEQTAKRKVIEAAAIKTAQAVGDFAKYHPLGLDPKLRAPLTIVEKNPKLLSLLDRLGACTGLDFTLADNLTYHDPVMGHFQLKNTFAYSLMEIIAQRDLDDGRWEKIDGGYRLEGTSKALRRPPPGFPWQRVAWGLAGLGVLGCLIFLGKRWKPAKEARAHELQGRDVGPGRSPEQS